MDRDSLGSRIRGSKRRPARMGVVKTRSWSVPLGCRGRGNEDEGKEDGRLTGSWKNRVYSDSVER